MKLLVSCLLASWFPAIAFGQLNTGPQPEIRVEAITGDPWSLLAGAGVNMAAGVYTRLGVNAAAGIARADARSQLAARVDGIGRFLLDPFRQSRTGLYGLAGVSAMYLEDDGWTPRVVLGLGLEGRARGRRITSIEVALGGGVRVAIVMRRVRPGGR